MKKVKLFCCDEYSVDDLGNVYSKSGNVLKNSTNPRGYLMINIMITEDKIHIIMMIMLAFELFSKKTRYI